MDALAEKVAEKVKARLEEKGGIVRPRLYDVKQAALYLGRTEEGVRGLYKAGTLPSVKPDGRVQFDVQDLDRWIEGHKES